MALASTRDRVPFHTAPDVNARLHAEMEARVHAVHANPANPARMAERLRELEEEWDVERAIEANASTLAFIGILLGVFHHVYWLVLPALVTFFLFQHAIQGWCPPIPVLRRMGFRTVYEIETERHALKALRGDYEGAAGSPAAALRAAAL